MPTILTERTVLTTREAAELLGVSVGTVQLWVESGQLEAWKTSGGHRRVLRASVEAMLQRRRRAAEAVTRPARLDELGEAAPHAATDPAAPPFDRSPAPWAASPPLSSPVSPPAAARTFAEPSARPLEVLVIEDDPNLLRLYAHQLSRWPMAPRVRTVGNAFTALLMLGHRPVDLLITDLVMPGMDGFAMLAALRTAPEVAQTTIVVVSGLDAQGIAARGGLPSSVAHFTKPVPFDRLQQLAQDMCRQNSFLCQGPA